MGGLPDDVLRFVEWRFAQKNRQAVYAALATPTVSTPRVMRAVLYLSNGSLSLLESYVKECRADVRAILTGAEYVIDVDGEPMRVRDMSLPFTDGHNLGQKCFEKGLAVVGNRPVSTTRKRTGSKPRSSYHSHLVQRSFKLGRATYVVARAQTRPDYVSCYRMDRTLARPVTLPRDFVVDQLAERIELKALEL